MKKTIKSILTLAIALVILVTIAVPAFADSRNIPEDIVTVADAFNLAYGEDDENLNDFIEIYSGKYDGKDVYVIALRGLNFTGLNPNDPRGYATAVKAILSNEHNQYVAKVVDAIKSNCKEYDNLVFIGHSLGGMIAQQVISHKDIKKNYNVLYTLAIGDPYIITKSAKEGTLVRVADKIDPVPFLSILGLANPYIGSVVYKRGTAGIIKSHFAYNDECWQECNLPKAESSITSLKLICDVEY